MHVDCSFILKEIAEPGDKLQASHEATTMDCQCLYGQMWSVRARWLMGHSENRQISMLQTARTF